MLVIMLSMSAQAYPKLKTHKKEVKTLKSAKTIRNGRVLLTLTSDNALILNRAFTSGSVSALIEEARQMDSKLKSGYPMFLVLYTPGGSIQAGLELYDFLEGLNRPIHTITMFAASMGFQTVQHLGDRYITRYGILMAHKARGGFQGEFGGGTSQLDSRYGMWLRRVRMMDEVALKRTNGKIKDLKAFYAMYAPELWLNGQEAVDVGLADAVATIKCDATLSGTRTVLYDLGFVKLNVMYSKCPANTAILDIQRALLTNQGEMPVEDFLANNGKFGKRCKDRPTAPERDWNGKVVGTARPAQLCATDKTLTLKKIDEMTEKKKTYLNRNLSENIIGYFGEKVQ